MIVIAHGDDIFTVYAHNKKNKVSKGERVDKGQVIGLVGNTGRSTGPHVHYETRIDDIPVDPMTFDTRGLGTC